MLLSPLLNFLQGQNLPVKNKKKGLVAFGYPPSFFILILPRPLASLMP